MLFYRLVFHNVGSHHDVITRLGQDSRPAALCGGLISTLRPNVFFAEVKPTVLNSAPSLLHWFYRRTENHTTIHCIGVHYILLFIDGYTLLDPLVTRWVGLECTVKFPC